MRIKDLYQQKKPVISFEVFPPKKMGASAAISEIYGTLEQLADLKPDYISVTYGAGGSGGMNKTCEIASAIQNKCGVPALAHLTCIAATRAQIAQLVKELGDEGIQNILAMRGDIPADPSVPLPQEYRYSQDLIADIKTMGNLCVAGACYPEGHIDCEDFAAGLAHLKQKQDAGADFLITQLFFDNSLFFRFLEQARAQGITLPISAGVMPILSRAQIERMIFMCGTSLPSQIIKLLHKYQNDPQALREAGIEYSVRQAEDLIANGVDGVHIYTMNQPDIARKHMNRIRKIAPAASEKR